MTIKSCSPFLYPHVRTITPTNTFTLDAAEEHIAFAGVFHTTGTLKAVAWYLGASTSPDLTLRVSIETQQAVVGEMVATTDAGKTLYTANAVSADIVNPSVGLIRTPINGTTGVSVTAGTNFAIVVRCVAYTSGSVGVRTVTYGSSDIMPAANNAPANQIAYEYAGSATYRNTNGIFALEYDSAMIPMPMVIPPNASTAALAWDNADNPDRRAMMFKFPDYGAYLEAALVYIDADDDFDVILYAADGYTALKSVSIVGAVRPANAYRTHYVSLGVTISADTWYRLAILPTTGTNILAYRFTYADIGAYNGLTATHEGMNVQYSTRHGAPSSGDAAWTDYDDQRIAVQLLVTGIDIPAGGSGGIYMPAPRMIGV